MHDSKAPSFLKRFDIDLVDALVGLGGTEPTTSIGSGRDSRPALALRYFAS